MSIANILFVGIWNKIFIVDMSTVVTMSLQWTIVATFLYSELFLCVLLMLPFLSPTRYVLVTLQPFLFQKSVVVRYALCCCLVSIVIHVKNFSCFIGLWTVCEKECVYTFVVMQTFGKQLISEMGLFWGWGALIIVNNQKAAHLENKLKFGCCNIYIWLSDLDCFMTHRVAPLCRSLKVM